MDDGKMTANPATAVCKRSDSGAESKNVRFRNRWRNQVFGFDDWVGDDLCLGAHWASRANDTPSGRVHLNAVPAWRAKRWMRHFCARSPRMKTLARCWLGFRSASGHNQICDYATRARCCQYDQVWGQLPDYLATASKWNQTGKSPSWNGTNGRPISTGRRVVWGEPAPMGRHAFYN